MQAVQGINLRNATRKSEHFLHGANVAMTPWGPVPAFLQGRQELGKSTQADTT